MDDLPDWAVPKRVVPTRLVHLLVKNQMGNHPKRWNKRGVVMNEDGHDQYQVLIGGSRRLARRNRQFFNDVQALCSLDSLGQRTRSQRTTRYKEKQ